MLDVDILASLPNMSICAGVIVAVALKQIDNAPNAEARAQRDNEGLKNTNRRSKKCHKKLLSCRSMRLPPKGQRAVLPPKKPPYASGGCVGMENCARWGRVSCSRCLRFGLPYHLLKSLLDMEKAQMGLAALRLLPFIEPFASGDKLPEFDLPLLLLPLPVRHGLTGGKRNYFLIHCPRPPVIPPRRSRSSQRLHQA